MEYRYTVNRVLRQTADELRSVAHEEAEIEARELVMHSLGVESRAELAANVNKEKQASRCNIYWAFGSSWGSGSKRMRVR